MKFKAKGIALDRLIRNKTQAQIVRNHQFEYGWHLAIQSNSISRAVQGHSLGYKETNFCLTP